LADIVKVRSDHLAGYQNGALAARYRAAVETVLVREAALGLGQDLARAVAINYAKVLAYKDEYEVARLYADGRFAADLATAFEGPVSFSVHLAPPLLARFDRNLGRPRKIRFGGWIMPVFRLLAALRGLRGTPFDPFGYNHERRSERALIARYEAMLAQVDAGLTAGNYQVAVRLAESVAAVRGFGPVKLTALRALEREWTSLLGAFSQPAMAGGRAAD
jgi:indolepyruvate ferredoxin oxidoreductase